MIVWDFCWLICSNELYHCIAHEMCYYLSAAATTSSCCAKCCCLTGMCTVYCWPGKDHSHAAVIVLLPRHKSYATMHLVMAGYSSAAWASHMSAHHCMIIASPQCTCCSASACIMHLGSHVLAWAMQHNAKLLGNVGLWYIYVCVTELRVFSMLCKDMHISM